MTARSAWSSARLAARARQSGKCAKCGKPFAEKRGGVFDAIRTSARVVEAFCRSCRCRRDARANAIKARATRQRKAQQMRLAKVAA